MFLVSRMWKRKSHSVALPNEWRLPTHSIRYGRVRLWHVRLSRSIDFRRFALRLRCIHACGLTMGGKPCGWTSEGQYQREAWAADEWGAVIGVGVGEGRARGRMGWSAWGQNKEGTSAGLDRRDANQRASRPGGGEGEEGGGEREEGEGHVTQGWRVCTSGWRKLRHSMWVRWLQLTKYEVTASSSRSTSGEA